MWIERDEAALEKGAASRLLAAGKLGAVLIERARRAASGQPDGPDRECGFGRTQADRLREICARRRG